MKKLIANLDGINVIKNLFIYFSVLFLWKVTEFY